MRVAKVCSVVALVSAFVSASCAAAAPAASAPPVFNGIALQTTPVPLNPARPSESVVNGFQYAGGLALSSTSSEALHGLSALIVDGTNELVAVGDLGVMFRARIVLDATGRLIDVVDGRLMPLVGVDGVPFVDRADADAEGLARLPNGDLLVSFERRHRILRYPADGRRPGQATSPDAAFPENGGMEALTADPEAGPFSYLVGGEESGQTWRCQLDGGCIEGPRVAKDEVFGLTAMTRVPVGHTAYLLRAFDPDTGNRIILSVVDAASREVGRLLLEPPMTVDNFEGLAAVAGPDDAVRFYLLSDDNAADNQRTLLMAFDWRPQGH